MSPGPNLVAGAAPSEASRARFQQRYGAVRTYADYNQMLDQEDLDIVGVATHAPLHADATVAAANAGAKGVLVSKPMAISLAECDRMIGRLPPTRYKAHALDTAAAGWNITASRAN